MAAETHSSGPRLQAPPRGLLTLEEGATTGEGLHQAGQPSWALLPAAACFSWKLQGPGWGGGAVTQGPCQAAHGPCDNCIRSDIEGTQASFT